jgi:hypothetical protein
MRYAFILGLAVALNSATTLVSMANPFASSGQLGRSVDNGGEVHDYAARVSQLNRRGGEFRIPDECYSACTMLLAVRTACVVEETALYFHAAYERSSGRIGSSGTLLMASYYPPRVLRLVERSGWLHSTRFRGRPDLTGRTLMALGMPKCGFRSPSVAHHESAVVRSAKAYIGPRSASRRTRVVRRSWTRVGLNSRLTRQTSRL